MDFPVKTSCWMLALAALAGLLQGCNVGPDFHRPAAPEASGFLPGGRPGATVAAPGPGGAAQRFGDGADLPGQWWTLFHSEPLDRLVRRGLEASPTLAQARARLVQAQEGLKAQTGADRYPAVDANLAATREKMDLAALGETSVPSPGPFTLYNASVSVSYTLDLFGGNRRALEGLAAQVDYQRFELEAARETLAANIVLCAIRQGSLQARAAALEALLAAQGRQLAITRARFQAGGVSWLEVQTQGLLLEQTRAMLPPLRKQRAQVEHQLAVYVGQGPGDGRNEPLDLATLQLPETLPLTLPSALARQRPDILAAEALLHQASAAVGVATANLYPQITLSGSLGSERTGASDLLDGFNVWSLGGGLAQPLFHGGALRARKRSAIAAYDEAAGRYRQTVLQALEEVADTLSALDADARTLAARAAVAEHARAGERIAEQQYRLGGISELALLDAQRQLLQAELDRVAAQADRYTDTATLFQALGGGWWQAPRSPQGD
jgi:NodT family efflux transporter outer membrane factor (OMF) lipoprotein